jgi:hypothetical protein
MFHYDLPVFCCCTVTVLPRALPTMMVHLHVCMHAHGVLTGESWRMDVDPPHTACSELASGVD